ncbi:hypothetical protein CspeluHIS016_0101120 [Cutaneotrichosporon spelunceum]|uniref:DnaJ-domain-containing protein n=1 Tax=Cutaneotrichosporon spelunceum TaxID=1672016 RepID=A0AAD3Y7I7_9TREE|nr:hypothetical protein CspeluHIS016_0101120 [Cutaneotrichosporon spelunceum]
MFLRPLQLVLALILLGQVLAASNYYSILGLKKDASDADVKRAYRKLSKKYHPDVNPDESAHEKFIEVSKAYEVLSETETRQIYDRGGEAALKRHEEHKAAGQNDPFAQFFGGGRNEPPRGPSVQFNLEVSLADMYSGRTIEFDMTRRFICSDCSGSGANSPADVRRCGTCNGQGVVVQKHQVFPGMFTNVQMTCPHCGGKGEQITKHCGGCGGARTVERQHTLAVHVPAGAPEGYEERFQGEADESPDFEPGDVIALLGFERNLTSLDGRTIPVGRAGTTQPGEVEVIEGEGMPSYHDIPQGDMYIEYSVVLPTAVSDGTRKKLADAFSWSGRRDEL